ncbi:MAG TPA: hypothetical protein VL634_20860 [Mycobacterium sp.]|nr:hypothetical protein [Mycobacterium sp.]
MDLLVIGAFGAFVIAVGCAYDARWQLSCSKLGVFDYTDVATLAIVVMVYPLLAVVEPPWLAAVIAGAVIVSSVADLAAPVLKIRAPQAIPLLLSGTAVVLVVTSHTGPIPGWALTDLLLVAVVVNVAVAWAQLGATPTHLAVLATFLTIYDVTATTLTGFMDELLGALGRQPISFMFTIPTAGGMACLGVGDVLILTLVPLTVGRRLGRHAALGAALVMYGAYLAGLAISATHPANTFPLMITLGPATLAIYGYTAVQRMAPAEAVGVTQRQVVESPSVGVAGLPAPVARTPPPHSATSDQRM